MDIPQEIAEYVSEFRLPAGGVIKKMKSSHWHLDGWVVEVQGGRWIYKDGVVHSRPRHRAVEAAGMSDEDELQNKPDKEWGRVEKLEEHFSHLLIQTLEEASQMARDRGLLNVRPANGTKVVDQQGNHGVVIFNFEDSTSPSALQDGLVRVEFEGEENPRMVSFSSLTY